MPQELVRSVQGLPLHRIKAVVAAQEAWKASGFSHRRATHSARKYARKLGAQQLAVQKRKQRSPSAKAAQKHEAQLRNLFLTAARSAQGSVNLTKLEAALVHKEVPWNLLEPAIAKLASALNG